MDETSQEQYVEMKPVIPAKTLHKHLRNILTNEFRLTKDSFEAQVAARVDRYITGPDFLALIERRVEKVFSTTNWGGPNGKTELNKLIMQQVQKHVDAIIGKAIRDEVAKVIPGLLTALIAGQQPQGNAG